MCGCACFCGCVDACGRQPSPCTSHEIHMEIGTSQLVSRSNSSTILFSNLNTWTRGHASTHQPSTKRFSDDRMRACGRRGHVESASTEILLWLLIIIYYLLLSCKSVKQPAVRATQLLGDTHVESFSKCYYRRTPRLMPNKMEFNRFRLCVVAQYVAKQSNSMAYSYVWSCVASNECKNTDTAVDPLELLFCTAWLFNLCIG